MNNNMTNLAMCRDCGCLCDADEMVEYVGGGYICDDCKAGYIICEDCGQAVEVRYSEDIHNSAGEVVKIVCKPCATENYAKCDDCGEYFLREDSEMIMVHGGDIICRGCFECGGYFICNDCGDAVRYDDEVCIHNWCGDVSFSVCPDCADSNYTQCEVCENYYAPHNVDSLSTDEGLYEVCDSCRGDMYYCEHCDTYFHNDDNWNSEHDCCNDCARDLSIILYYGDSVYWEMFVNNKPIGDDDFFGIELEVERDGSGYDCNEMAEELRDRYFYNHAVYKHDGSLHDGFEIITHPHTPAAFYDLPWHEILDYLGSNDFTSHDNGRCGLHIHMNRKWFGATRDEQYANITKMAVCYCNRWDFFLACSRRTQYQADRWAKKYILDRDIDDTDDEMLKKAEQTLKDEEGYSRYLAINLCNRDTFEFRLGRGTLKYESFMAWIDIHITMARNAKHIRAHEHDNLTRWLKGVKPETLDYIRSRNALTYEECKEIESISVL